MELKGGGRVKTYQSLSLLSGHPWGPAGNAPLGLVTSNGRTLGDVTLSSILCKLTAAMWAWDTIVEIGVSHDGGTCDTAR